MTGAARAQAEDGAAGRSRPKTTGTSYGQRSFQRIFRGGGRALHTLLACLPDVLQNLVVRYFGERLFAARQQMGLSQIELAEKLGITQSTYAGWERRTTALKPHYISSLAAFLNVPVDYLLGHQDSVQRKGGPVGKARRVFEEVSRLPRHQQKRILGIVEDLLAALHAGRRSSAG